MDKLVDVVLANNDRVTVRVGDTFLKIDADHERADLEAAAIALAPIPTPEILWHEPPVLALAAVRGRTLGRLGHPSSAPAAAWSAVGAAVRQLHDAPLPPWPATSAESVECRMNDACGWLLANDVLPARIVERNRKRAELVLRPYGPVFVHGDLHLEHVFVDGDDVSGIIDWSEARQGDPLWDLASLTLGNEQHVDDVLAGYGRDVDQEMVRAWWSWRSLVVVPWLVANGYGDPDEFPEVGVLRSLA
ncbi:MAG: phosphotransferase [Actinomycetota bacterium]